jgi:hypothetical protein
MEGEGIGQYSLKITVVGDHEQLRLADRRDDLRYAVGGVVDEDVAIGTFQVGKVCADSKNVGVAIVK